MYETPNFNLEDFISVNLEKYQNFYDILKKSESTDTALQESIDNIKKSYQPSEELKFDFSRGGLSVAGNLDQNAASAYSQTLQYPITRILTNFIQQINSKNTLKSNYLFSKAFKSKTGKSYYVTCATDFQVIDSINVESPSWCIPGAVLLVYAHSEKDNSFNIEHVLVSNDGLLADIFEGKPIFENVIANLKRQTINNSEEYLSSPKLQANKKSQSRELSKKFLEQIQKVADDNKSLFDLKYPNIQKAITGLQDRLIELSYEEQNFSAIFIKLSRKLNYIDQKADLLENDSALCLFYEKTIAEFRQDLEKIIKDFKIDDQNSLKSHVQEVLNQASQPMINHMLDNLRNHKKTLRDSTKFKKMDKLITDLQSEKKTFYSYNLDRSANAFETFSENMTQTISKQAKSLNIPEKDWTPILKTVLVSLTGVGLLLTIPKAAYGIITGTSPFWFQTREEAGLYEQKAKLQKTTESINSTLIPSPIAA